MSVLRVVCQLALLDCINFFAFGAEEEEEGFCVQRLSLLDQFRGG